MITFFGIYFGIVFLYLLYGVHVFLSAKAKADNNMLNESDYTWQEKLFIDYRYCTDNPNKFNSVWCKTNDIIAGYGNWCFVAFFFPLYWFWIFINLISDLFDCIMRFLHFVFKSIYIKYYNKSLKQEEKTKEVKEDISKIAQMSEELKEYNKAIQENNELILKKLKINKQQSKMEAKTLC